MTTIGERIRELRERVGLTQADLARQIGIAQPSLWQIENGRTKSLRAKTLSNLCTALVTTPTYLQGQSGEDNQEQAVMESELIQTLRALDAEKRIALMEFARHLRGQKRPAETPQQDGRAAVHQIKKKAARR